MPKSHGLKKPLFKPMLFRIAAGAMSEEINVSGADRLYIFASGADGADASLHVWGRGRCMVPDASETTTPPTTIPLELPDPLTESNAWFSFPEMTPSVKVGPPAPDGRVNEYSSDLLWLDIQMCDRVKIHVASVTGVVTIWAGASEAEAVTPPPA